MSSRPSLSRCVHSCTVRMSRVIHTLSVTWFGAWRDEGVGCAEGVHHAEGVQHAEGLQHIEGCSVLRGAACLESHAARDLVGRGGAVHVCSLRAVWQLGT